MKFKTPVVKIGKVLLGGGNPVVIQSMTNTDTVDFKATAAQCIELAKAGSEMVRITVDTEASAQAVPKIREILNKKGYKNLPLIGDFHFNGHKLLSAFPECARSLDKYRINPGNVGFRKDHDENFATMIKIAIKYKKAVRIGVNFGSIDRELFTKIMDKNAKQSRPKSDREVVIETMTFSALSSAKFAEKLGLPQNQIVLSVKMSDVQDVIKAYELLAEKMKNHPYALHLGLTEAGSGTKGLVSSSAVIAILLQQGIGDTIRISLTPDKFTPRTCEVEACKMLLQSMGFRHFSPSVTSCPGCGRTNNIFFQKLADQTNKYIQKNMSVWRKKYPGIEHLKIAVMGCVVNGPGESSHADLGISLPGKGEKPLAVVYKSGKLLTTLHGENITDQFLKILEKYIKEKF